MVLRRSGNAGEGGFEDHCRDPPPRGELDGDPRPQRLAPQHDPVRRDPLAGDKIERRGAVRV